MVVGGSTVDAPLMLSVELLSDEIVDTMVLLFTNEVVASTVLL